jgi:hypothetical protein
MLARIDALVPADLAPEARTEAWWHERGRTFGLRRDLIYHAIGAPEGIPAWTEDLALTRRSIDFHEEARRILGAQGARETHHAIELCIQLGQLELVNEGLCRLVEREDPAIAEVWRLRGEQAKVIEVATGRITPTSIIEDRANFRAVRARALADLGRFDEARRDLEALTLEQDWQPALPQLAPARVARYIAEKAGGR